MMLDFAVNVSPKIKYKKMLDKYFRLCYNVIAMRIWRNWQTRMVQVHMFARTCRFKSCYPHQRRAGACSSRCCSQARSLCTWTKDFFRSRQSCLSYTTKECLSKGYEKKYQKTHKVCWALFLLYQKYLMSCQSGSISIIEATIHIKSHVNGLVCILVPTH